LSNYTEGQGATLKANPFWGGAKAKVGEVDFKIITDTNTEEEAMRGGEVDAITPTFGLYLAPLKSTPGLTYNQIPGYYLERINFREGSAPAGPSVNKGASNKLLRAPWMREAIAKAELKSIGIQLNEKPLAANVVFGPTGIPSGDFDIAEYANITTGDPGDWTDLYRCQGPGNYTGYCSHKADKLMQAGNGELDTAKRAADFQAADKLMASTAGVFPLYQRPAPLIHKSDLLGMVNNPANVGVFWNI